MTNTEILDGTILFADIGANGCSSGEIFEYNGSAWICGTDDDTTYSAGTGINFAGTVISSTLGTDIDSSEIVDSTITTDDIAANTITAADLATDSVGSDEIAADAVGASEIATGAVTTTEILNLSLIHI